MSANDQFDNAQPYNVLEGPGFYQASSGITGQTEHLDAGDFTWFVTAMNQFTSAQTNLNFVQEVLRQKYDLKEGDQVKPDGQIIRA